MNLVLVDVLGEELTLRADFGVEIRTVVCDLGAPRRTVSSIGRFLERGLDKSGSA
jgi:hypothetical protein